MNKYSNRILFVLIIVLLEILTFGCGGPPDNGHVGPIGPVGPQSIDGTQSNLTVIEDTDVIIYEEYSFSGFSSLEIGDGFDVTVTKGEDFNINTRFEETAIPFIEMKIEDETLIIMLKPDLTYNMVNITLEVEITMPELKKIVLTNGADATINGLSGYESEVDFLSNLYQ